MVDALLSGGSAYYWRVSSSLISRTRRQVRKGLSLFGLITKKMAEQPSRELDEKYMKEALKEAALALDEGEIPIGAVIVCKGRIIGRGHNMTERLHDPTAHAEMIAITAATEALGGKYLPDCTLYVTVEPCPMCAGALGWSQIGRIVYGAPDPRRGYSLFVPSLLHPRTQVGQDIMMQECSDLLVNFFKDKRK